jgi:hypothetical protein
MPVAKAPMAKAPMPVAKAPMAKASMPAPKAPMPKAPSNVLQPQVTTEVVGPKPLPSVVAKPPTMIVAQKQQPKPLVVGPKALKRPVTPTR